MKNFFKNNKIILTNSILVLTTITLFLFKKHINENFYIYLKFSTYFSIAFSITNWLFLKILMKKLKFLYSIEKIKEILIPIQNFLTKEIFTSKKIKKLNNNQTILTNIDITNIEKIINTSISQFFEKTKILNQFKDVIIFSIQEIELKLTIELEKILKNKNLKNKVAKIESAVLFIINQHFENFVIFKIQKLIYDTLKNYFEWFVIWGALCGILWGVVFVIFRII